MKNLGSSLLAFVMLIVAISVVAVINKLTTPSPLIDKDNDGYYTIAVEGKLSDCNDDDNNIYPDAPEIENDGLDQDCNGSDKLPEFNPSDFINEFSQFDEFESFKKNGDYTLLYTNQITPEIINNKTIVNLSKRIKTNGKFKKVYLFASAGVNKNEKLTNGESIYFYVDTGDSGGHLIKSKSLSINYEKVNNNRSNYLYETENLALTTIPYKEESTPVVRNLSLLDILNSENHGYDRKHYIGAFVSSNRLNPTLSELSIGYECEVDSPCRIEIIK